MPPIASRSLVQKTPRTDAAYGRITVGQGIVIDPLHPQQATVFALVMNDQELRLFQKKLEQSFPERVEEAEADPVVVAQLGRDRPPDRACRERPPARSSFPATCRTGSHHGPT